MMRHVLSRAVWLVSCLLVASCNTSEPVTQIMVMVRSDIAELDNIEISVDGMGPRKTAKASLAKTKLPRTLAVVHRGGALGPITISARGYVAGELWVERSARLSFSRNRNVTLVLDLAQACAQVACSTKSETCVAGSCASNSVDVGKLKPWPGSVKRVDVDDFPEVGMDAGSDAGESDAAMMATDATVHDAAANDAAMPDAAEGCDDGEEDCDDDGECDALTTLTNCGACGDVCETDEGIADPHAELSCAAQVCELTCAAGFLDLDGEVVNGCEGVAFAQPPSHVDVSDVALQRAAAPLTIDCDASLDLGNTDLPETVTLCDQPVHPQLVTQVGGPDLVVLPLHGFQVLAGKSLTLLGARPVVLVVFGDATVAGTINASGAAGVPGPGGHVSCTTPGGAGVNGGSSSSRGGGGSGGGFGSAGGAGGNGNGSGSGAAATTLEGGSGMTILRGGCAGGNGGTGTVVGGAGGGGGGALQLSVAGTLQISGTVAAAGGGGSAPAAGPTQAGGGGGGSGGAILVEAASLEIAVGAWLTANGGSGAEAGSTSGASAPVSGAPGPLAASTAALGGSEGSETGGDGGNGASLAAATSGKNGTTSGILTIVYGGGGGGGGGTGRLLIRSPVCSLLGTTSPTTLCN